MVSTILSHYQYFFEIFLLNPTPTTAIYTLSLHDALPICSRELPGSGCSTTSTSCRRPSSVPSWASARSEEHTSELQSLRHLVCRLLLEKKNIIETSNLSTSQHVSVVINQSLT